MWLLPTPQVPLPSFGRKIQSDLQADVAQLVEQLIRNQQVVSSSLTVGSIPHHPRIHALLLIVVRDSWGIFGDWPLLVISP
jgi:hypothetical protein